MPRKRTAEVTKPDEPPIESVYGRHPSLNQIHRMSRYKNGLVYIEREPLIRPDPAGGTPQTTPFPPLLEKFHNHRFLWDAIKSNPLPNHE